MHRFQTHHFPFTAIVGQDELRLALILSAIEPRIGGLLIRGEKGTGRSTAAKGLAAALPEIEVVSGCPQSCHPREPGLMCDDCASKLERGEELPTHRRPVPFVTVPLSVTEERLVGTTVASRSSSAGGAELHPGLLAAANRGVLYVDDIDRLDDHLVSVLLQAAASGRNLVERDGRVASHPARFVLVGTVSSGVSGPRPQLLDRFGMVLDTRGIRDLDQRVEILERIHEFERDPPAATQRYKASERELTERIGRAMDRVGSVEVSPEVLRAAAKRGVEAGTEGHRADLALVKVGRALAAWQDDDAVQELHLDQAAQLVLPSRRRTPERDREPDEPPPRPPEAKELGAKRTPPDPARATLPSPVATPPRPGQRSDKTKPLVALPEARAGGACRGPDRAVCLVIDAGSSSGVVGGFEVVRAIALGLVASASRERCHISVIVAQGGKARCEVLLTQDAERLDRALSALRSGGRTPMAHAYILASQELQRARDRGLSPTLVVLVAGRATASLTVGGDPVDDAMEATLQLAGKPFDGLMVAIGGDRTAADQARVMAERLRADFLRREVTGEDSPDDLVERIADWLATASRRR